MRVSGRDAARRASSSASASASAARRQARSSALALRRSPGKLQTSRAALRISLRSASTLRGSARSEAEKWMSALRTVGSVGPARAAGASATAARAGARRAQISFVDRGISSVSVVIDQPSTPWRSLYGLRIRRRRGEDWAGPSYAKMTLTLRLRQVALMRALAHRFEQYFTSSQWRAHFLRQPKGRLQTGQIFSGRSAFAVARFRLRFFAMG